MLYVLTGRIQTGKTRWLQSQIARKQQEGMPVYGVIAPGIWRDHGQDASPRYEKLGINNVLLPDDVTVPFAQRRDLADQQGRFAQGTQAAAEKLGWAISDEAIAQVDAHFKKLLALSEDPEAKLGFLVVDELGRLELLRNQGLVNAVKLLEKGPTSLAADALIIVRKDLLPYAYERFADSWPEIKEIKPGYDLP